ncbi:hypothetical protein [Virgibacillus sp. MSP4-1]|uniref:hypothetical protein n=1 Tax=Virgibacillus sp. MSP4-1 TaxID=2700081 RepID=UPI00039BC80B|nr:hypothetical protein [Virgibacillus sp. MSP4-1]
MSFQVFSTIQKKVQLKKDTITYLVDKGYDEETDIKEIEVVKLLELNEDDEAVHNGRYQAVVKFKDEPETTSFYTYKRDTKNIIRIDMIEE